MSEEPPSPVPTPPTAPKPRGQAPATPVHWVAAGLFAMVLIVAAALVVGRYGVLTPQGLALIEARINSLKLGAAGSIKLEGLRGDVWRAFTARRITVADDQGVWLEADGVAVRWSPEDLLDRLLRIDAVAAKSVRVLRRPHLAAAGKPSAGLPVSIDIGAVRLRLELLPAFSVTRGLFDVGGRLRLDRGGRGGAGAIEAKSLLHEGDFLSARFDVGRRRRLRVTADAREGQGGALAGSLGLAANRPLLLTVRAEGNNTRGRLEARLVSGASTPLEAHGQWSKVGGVLAARAALSDSSLTARYVGMLGPQAVIAAAGRRAKDGRFGVAVRAISRNLVVIAQGPADLTKRTTPGLQAAATVADLSRLIAAPKMGAGHAQGVLQGGLGAWRFAGTAEVAGLETNGLRLARVSGPLAVSLRKREVGLQAALAGMGGQGTSLVARLAGPAPRVEIDASRLADGRILIRKADASGSGFKLAASGGRGLLGGLNFKGRLEIPNAGALRAGAGGALAAQWTAGQVSAGRPWMLSFDARGEKLRSGLGELDRLLGPAPRLRAQATYSGGAFAVAKASLDGDKAYASAAGKLDPRGPLALKVDWRAEGPFQAGPVLIAGKASGKGAVTGTLGAPRADLDADFAAIDVPSLPLKAAHVHLAFAKEPQGVGGAIEIAADSAYGPAKARSAFRFAPGGVDLSGVDADAGGVKATGALSLRGGAPSTADLQLAIGPGALLSEGRVAGTVKIVDAAAPTADVELQATGAAPRGSSGVLIRAARISAQGPLNRLPFQATAQAVTPQGDLTFDGSGVYQQMGQGRQIALNAQGSFRKVPFNTLEPLTVLLSGDERTTRARLMFGGGRMELDARQAKGAFTATGALHDVELKAVNQDFAGRFDADFRLQGEGDQLGGDMTARLDGARDVDAPADVAVNGVVKAALRGGRLAVDAQASGAKGMTSSINLDLPVEASAAPLRLAVVRNRPMQGRFAADGEVEPLWDLFYGGDRELAGKAHMSGTLGGTLNDPQIAGDASLASGRFRDATLGLVLTDASLTADLKRDVVIISGFNAKDEKGGTVSGSGSISLQRGGGSNLKLDLSRFRLLDNDTAEAQASGPVTITRDANGQIKLVGDLSIDRAQINAEARLRPSVVTMDVVEKNKPARLDVQLQPPATRGPSIAVDVTMSAPGRVFVKGRGIDAELSVFAHVTGTMAQPHLQGTARIVQGDYDFAGKRFEFDERGSIVLADSADRIRLDLSAAWEGPTITATIQIRGTAAKPEISLTSSPGLPQDEIMSQVLFGTSASQLSGSQTAELASTVTALATGGGFDVLGSLRTFARLDRLSFGGDQASGMTVSGGKYITDKVYLELIGGGRQGPSAEVDWRIKRGFSLVSQIGGEFGAKLVVRWSHDIGQKRRPGAPPSPPATPKGAPP